MITLKEYNFFIIKNWFTFGAIILFSKWALLQNNIPPKLQMNILKFGFTTEIVLNFTIEQNLKKECCPSKQLTWMRQPYTSYRDKIKFVYD